MREESSTELKEITYELTSTEMKKEQLSWTIPLCDNPYRVEKKKWPIPNQGRESVISVTGQ